MSIRVEVIVPVYNAAPYLQRCINSLLEQTYDDYSILLVDDGSTDASGAMCDAYAESYNRVRVIHKENGGLSSARNFGVNYTDIEYITFVDADDFASSYLIDDLVRAMRGGIADMSAIHTRTVRDSFCAANNNRKTKTIKTEVMDTKTALEVMCYGALFGVSACGKLFQRKLLLKHPFPEDTLYEDLATTYKIISESDRIGYLNTTDYFYVQYPKKGITRGRYTKKHMEIIKISKNLKEFLTSYYPNIEAAGIYRIAFGYLLLTKTVCGFSDRERNVYRMIKRELRQVLLHEGVLYNPNVRVKTKARMCLCALGYYPMVTSWKMYYCLLYLRRSHA